MSRASGNRVLAEQKFKQGLDQIEKKDYQSCAQVFPVGDRGMSGSRKILHKAERLLSCNG